MATLITFHKYHGDQQLPPPYFWKACRPSAVERFKATITCPNGHGMVLKHHIVSHGGVVSPSVICREKGCDFHAFIFLEDWVSIN